MKPPAGLTRRAFLSDAAALTATSAVGLHSLEAAAAEDDPPSHQASGVKVGEVTPDSAIVWTRLTATATRNDIGRAVVGKVKRNAPQTVDGPIAEFQGACPGAPGRLRIRYGTEERLTDGRATDWADVSDKTDSTHQFRLSGLKPATTYHYAVETTGPDGTPPHGSLQGRFETAPAAETPSNFLFCVMTCQAYHDRDHPDGHNIYPSMLRLKPRFVAFTGDNVYYDSEEPQAVTAELARYHWQRMFSLPRQRELLRNVASYWEKDDHDTVNNDSWPGTTLGGLTFVEGQTIFRQQVPLGEMIYRTFRWGRDLQIWLTDGRDFRSSNRMPDGPEKTIWGAEQKAWLKRTLKESDATWKVLISPTPLVGPDRGNKADNHANRTFQHEGDEIRAWFRANVPDNFFVICGDRHWQYHSVHPRTGLNEFACGPASDAHASGSPGEDKTYHRFHRVKGGFLSVTLRPEEKGRTSRLLFRHHNVRGNVVYEFSPPAVTPRA